MRFGRSYLALPVCNTAMPAERKRDGEREREAVA